MFVIFDIILKFVYLFIFYGLSDFITYFCICIYYMECIINLFVFFSVFTAFLWYYVCSGSSIIYTIPELTYDNFNFSKINNFFFYKIDF